MLFVLFNFSIAQNTRQDENKTFIISEEGIQEISSYELIFSESSCDSNTGILKVYFSEIRSNLIDRGLNVTTRILDSGKGVISFQTATTISLDMINSWLASQGITASELNLTISKN